MNVESAELDPKTRVGDRVLHPHRHALVPIGGIGLVIAAKIPAMQPLVIRGARGPMPDHHPDGQPRHYTGTNSLSEGTKHMVP